MIESNDVLKLKYDDDLKSVIMIWNGFAGREEFREANEEVLGMIKDTGAQKLIGDLREMKIINVKNQQWLLEDWLPRTISAGVIYFALVESQDFFNRKSVASVVEKMPENVTIRYFNTLVSARAWMRTIN